MDGVRRVVVLGEELPPRSFEFGVVSWPYRLWRRAETEGALEITAAMYVVEQHLALHLASPFRIPAFPERRE